MPLPHTVVRIWGQTLKDGLPSKRNIAAGLALLLTVLACDFWDRRRNSPATSAFFSVGALATIFTVWTGVTALTVWALWQTWSHNAVMIGLATLGTLVIPWVIWLRRLPCTAGLRVVGFLGLSLLTLPFHILLQADGLAGNGRSVFTWKAGASAPQATTPTQIERTLAASTSKNALESQASRTDANSVLNDRHIDQTRTAGFVSQFRGPSRTATWPDIHLTDWAKEAPREQWRRPVGAAWSAFVTHPAGLAITQEQLAENECVTAYNLATGEPVWRDAHRARFDTSAGGIGPRATPTIVGNLVFAVGATGRLSCLDVLTGERQWSVETVIEGMLPIHGISASPLVMDEIVYACPGELPTGPCLAAYRVQDGKLLWQTGTHRARYSSPMLAKFGDITQLLLFHADGVSGYDPQLGKERWTVTWANTNGNSISQPVWPAGDSSNILVSTGYGQGGMLFAVQPPTSPDSPWATHQRWTSRHLKTKFSSAVILNDTIYALDENILVAVDVNSGETLRKGGRFGYGQILLIGDQLLVQTERGDLVQLNAERIGNDVAWHEAGRLTAFHDKTWNYPYFSGTHLLVRNDREAVCFELSIEQPSP